MALNRTQIAVPRTARRTLPDEVSGYAFDPEHSWWASVKPEPTTNLVINPSFEGWGVGGVPPEYDLGGSFALEEYVEFPSIGAAYGTRCLHMRTGAGSGWVDYDEGIAVTPGPYTFSVDVYVVNPPLTVILLVLDDATAVATNRHVIRRPGWQRLHLTYNEQATDTRILRLLANNLNPAGIDFYSDAWQFEAKAYPTSYCDGDMIGFNDVKPYDSYYWTGERHHSQSVRRETTGSGGRLISWSEEAHFLTTTIVGLGMTTVEPWLQPLADGSEVMRGVRIRPRDFTITGRIFGRTYRELIARQNDLLKLLRPDNTLGHEPLLLRYQQVDDEEQPYTQPLEIVAVYTEGLQGNTTNFNQTTLALQFHASQPAFRECYESAAQLELYKTLVANFMIFKDETGDYLNLGSGASNAFPTNVGFMRSGHPVVFGPFATLAGDSVALGAYWDGDSWVEMDDAPAGVEDVDDGYDTGYPLVVATTSGDVYEYDATLNQFSQLGDGFIGGIFALDRDAEGNIWVGGEFELAEDGITVYNNVAVWNYADAEWQQLGTGVTDPGALNPDLNVQTVLAPNDGYVYIGGWFEQADHASTTTFTNGVIRWNIERSEYEAMGSGFNAAPNQFILGHDNYIYATGAFDQNGTETYDLRGFARWNGFEWEEVFPLQRADGSFGADGMALDENGIIWFFAYTTTDDDLFVVPGLGTMGTFGYKNGVFYPGFSSTSVQDMAIGPGNRTIYAVRDVEGLGVYRVPYLAEIEYQGSTDAPFVLHMDGPGHPIQALNLATKGGVYFKGSFNLGLYEQMVVRADTQKSLAYSNVRANLFSQLAAGPSDTHALRLRPGLNRVSFYGRDADDSTRVWITWRNHYHSLDGADA